MVRWRRLLISVFPGVSLFLIVPLAIVLVYVTFVGLDVNLLLAMILLFQLYLIAIQAEISLRQTTILMTEYNPTLAVETVPVSTAAHRAGELRVGLSNIGKAPAYNVFIAAQGASAPLESQTSATLGAGEMIGLFVISDDDFAHEIVVNVLYNNSLGEPREVRFVKMPRNREFYLISGAEKPGFFLNQLESLRMAFLLMKHEKRRRQHVKEA